jgi:hypothetical protein
MESLLENMGNLGIRSEEDLLEQLLLRMGINDSDGNQVRPEQPVQTTRGNVSLNELLNSFNNFNDFLINSPYVVQENPQFVVLTVNGINFNAASVPRDKNKLGWKVLSTLCARSFFKPIKGRTLYDRLRKNYYVNGRKTILKFDGIYYIYDDSDKSLTIAQIPNGYRDYFPPLSSTYSAFNTISDVGSLKHLLVGYEDQLLLGMQDTPGLRTSLRKIIDEFPVFRNIPAQTPIPVQGVPGIIPVGSRIGIPGILGVRTAPEPDDIVMGEYRQDRQMYVIPSKRNRTAFGKKKGSMNTWNINWSIKQINKLIKEVMKY